jgi:hypothetical protein
MRQGREPEASEAEGRLRHDAKRDENELPIVRALEACGFTVQRLAGQGMPDLMVGGRGRVWCLEVKMPGKVLNPLQREWVANWRGHYAIVHDAREALAQVM